MTKPTTPWDEVLSQLHAVHKEMARLSVRVDELTASYDALHKRLCETEQRITQQSWSKRWEIDNDSKSSGGISS